MTKKHQPPARGDHEDATAPTTSVTGRDHHDHIERAPLAATLGDFVAGFDLSNPDGRSSLPDEATTASAPIAASLGELVERFDLSNDDGRSSLPGDATIAP